MKVYINKSKQLLCVYMFYVVIIYVTSPVPDGTGKTIAFSNSMLELKCKRLPRVREDSD